MKRSFVSMFLLPFVLVGCGQQKSQQKSQHNSNMLSDGTYPVTWSSLSSKEQQAILEVSKHYGEPNPKVEYVHDTKTDSDQKLMYIVELSGHFHQGNATSSDLGFSILGDASMAWAIANKEHTIQHGQLVFH